MQMDDLNRFNFCYMKFLIEIIQNNFIIIEIYKTYYEHLLTTI